MTMYSITKHWNFSTQFFLFVVKQSFIGEVHLQVLGVQSDVLFPVTQQREIERLLKEAGMCLVYLS